MAPTLFHRWLGMLLSVGFAAAPASAEVYRYKDSNGNWVYADRQPDDGRRTEPVKLSVGATAPRILVVPRSSANGIAMVAVNGCRCSVEFGVRVDAESGAKTARAVVPPQSEQLLLEVPAPAGVGQIPFDYGYVIGEPGAQHAPDQLYRAPFATAQSFAVTQAPPDQRTHRDAGSRNAIDFAMPVGSEVHAARGGLVINVAHRHFRGGMTPSDQDTANFVQILHDDGTNAIYAHLQMDTIRVRPGQRVERGEYIANSGNTGFSSGPHLHFVVLRNAGMRSESVPVSFEGPGGAAVAPRSGEQITAH